MIFDLDLPTLRRRTSAKWQRFEPDVLPMFVAEMDARVPAPVAERITRAISDGDMGYPEPPTYREAFARFADWRWGWRPEVADIMQCGDVMHGMLTVMTMLTEPGDAVVINTPIYPPFRYICTTAGRTLVEAPLTSDGRQDLNVLEAAFAGRRGPRPTVFLLSNPQNPNGTVFTAAELADVAELAERYGVRVIVDEIHAPLIAPGTHPHVPYVTVPGGERGYVVTSASKAWNLAAIKCGLIIAGPQARAELEMIPAEVKYNASHLGAIAHTAALDDARDWLDEVIVEIDANKAFLADRLKEQLGLDHRPSQGTYLAWVDCAPLGLENPGRTFHEVGRVRFNNGLEFGREYGQFVRINCATSQDLIAEGVERMVRSL